MVEKIDSLEVLKNLYKRMVERGEAVKKIQQTSVDIDSHFDYHRTTYTRLHGEISLVQTSDKMIGLAKGSDYYGLYGLVANSFSFPLQKETIKRLNGSLDRRLDKNPLPKNASLDDLNKDDIENLFDYVLPWYGVARYHTPQLEKIWGRDCRFKEQCVGEEFEAEEPEKDYFYGKEAGVYMIRKHPGVYKHPETVEHLESWLAEKLAL